jgi:azurin
MIFSTNLSFIPVDVKFGPRGDLYICDWYNPIKGHMQYSLRDSRRDRTSGRIWRVVPKGAKLPAAPTIVGAPIPALLELLKSPQYRIRDLAKRELAERDHDAVVKAVDSWKRALDRKETRFRHHQVEALWLLRSIDSVDAALLKEVAACEHPQARAAATQQLRYVSASVPGAMEILRERANDESGLVRMEAVIAASYIGTQAALETILGALEKSADLHVGYAIRTSLDSAALSKFWKDNESYLAAHPEIAKFNQHYAAASAVARRRTVAPKVAKAELDFDTQAGLATVRIETVPERMLFDTKRFTVKAGQAVRLVFRNADAMQHNLVIVKPGALEEVGLAGNDMAKDPDGIKKDFVPATDKVLHATKLIDPQGSTVLRFKAPTTPGEYPYVCTFPGHWVIMNGVMEVVP